MQRNTSSTTGGSGNHVAPHMSLAVSAGGPMTLTPASSPDATVKQNIGAAAAAATAAAAPAVGDGHSTDQISSLSQQSAASVPPPSASTPRDQDTVSSARLANSLSSDLAMTGSAPKGAGKSSSEEAIGGTPSVGTALFRRWSCETCRQRKIKCDGVRPLCGFCAKRGIATCVFLGSKERVDQDLATKYQAEVERRGSTRDRRATFSKMSPTLNETPASRQPVDPHQESSKGGGVDQFSESARAALPSDTSTRAVLSQFDSHLFGFIPYSRFSSLSLEPTQANLFHLHRPNAPPGEEARLVSYFFALREFPLNFIHRPSFFANMDAANPLLRLSLCAAGAAIQKKTRLPASEIAWYYDVARSLAQDAVDMPSVAAVQALTVLAFVTNTLGCHSASWQYFGMAARMAMFLHLDVDPDDLSPDDLEDATWIGKETRRRTWWTVYIFERGLSTISYRKPLCNLVDWKSIKPLCPEELWCSEKDVTSLAPLVENLRSPRNHLLMFQIGLLEISFRAFHATKPVFSSNEDPIILEEQLYEELVDFHRRIPSQFEVILNEDWLDGVVNAENHAIYKAVGLFVIYHGTICLLMRRQSMMYLQSIAAELQAASASGWTISQPVREALKIQQRLRSAFCRGLASAEALSVLIGFFFRTVHDPFNEDTPHLLLFYHIQAVLTLIMAEGLVNPLMASNSPSERIPSNEQISLYLNSYMKFISTNTASRTLGKLFMTFINGVRKSDWRSVYELDESGLPQPCPQLKNLSPLEVPATDFPGRVQLFRVLVRDFADTIREARETSAQTMPSLCPAPKASLEPQGAEFVLQANVGSSPPTDPDDVLMLMDLLFVCTPLVN
ncbi:fungal-specific transcription factor domain-containing protein [Zopfochytrium polystomum]|nr:fungal-specific transcription factor domain-containing protein [Zopfochytrium polystomum]